MRRRLNRWLARDYGKDSGRHESGYHAILPRVGAQVLLLNKDGSLADDVRFHIFRDQFGCGHIGTGDRQFGRRVTYFDENFTPLDVSTNRPRHVTPKPKPQGFEDMLRIAHLLARHLDYMRVDFLSAGDRFFLNEITLYHTSGFSPIKPRSFEEKMGALWHLPDRKGRG
ncbi:MAG: hypothetical protein GKR99_10325 [Rhodobacteraceae bacterium]|nr:hypothetical protein [Paracoccaceae bacterium]